MNSRQKYLVEVRDEQGRLDFRKEDEVRKAHPYLFEKREYKIDDLEYYASYGQGRNTPMGPLELPAFMKSIGVTYRPKTW